MKIEPFLKELASDTPTPGGGCASALTGALAASLIAMVAGLSLKKGKLPAAEARRMRMGAMSIQGRLCRAIDEDAEGYNAVLRAFRLPGEREKERLHRSRMIQKALEKATVAPQVVCEQAIHILEFCKPLLTGGNPNTTSDTAVAAHLANAALEGGILNIRINLTSIRDRSFRREKERLIRHFSKKRDRWMAGILQVLEKAGA